MSQAKRLLAAYVGATNAHGTTIVGRVGRNGKAESQSRIVREPLTEELVQGHIDGKRGVGAIPINNDNECKFGAIDVDVYDLNHKELQAKIQKLDLPLLHCRSKSGGAHLYLFLKEFEKAAIVREYLTEMSILLGYSGCEIFPKQDQIIAERGDVGNFINMPYFDAEMPQRFCYNENTEAMELDEFLDAVEKKRTSLAELEAVRATKKMRKHFEDGPPCLRYIFENGPQSEPRNKLLFMIAWYCRNKFPDSWQEALEEYNRTLCSPPLPAKEMATLIGQHEKKDYGPTCKDEPFKSYCDPQLCATARYGIGSDAPDAPQVGGLTIMLSEPRLYFMDVNGTRIQLTTEQLQNQTLWQRACMEQCMFMPPTTKARTWQQMVNGLMSQATYLDVPEELTIKGQFKELLRSYCTSYVRAMVPEEIEMGKPWTDGGVTKFKLDGLLEFLHNRRFKVESRGAITQMIRDLGGDNTKQNINKRTAQGETRSTVRCWFVPAFDEEEIELPKKEMSNDIPF
jgi:hypothetical protein